MKLGTFKSAIAASALVLSTTFANAAVFTLPAVGEIDIDFRSDKFAAADGQGSFDSGDGFEIVARPDGEVFFQDNTDGLGVRGGEEDEIDGKERIFINFTEDFSENYLVDGVFLTDLFAPQDGNARNEDIAENLGEDAVIRVFLTDGTEEIFSVYGRDSDQQNGEQFVDFGDGFEVTQIQFIAPDGDQQSLPGNEFSVAGLSVVAVPEPSTLALMGLVLAGIGSVRRKVNA